jgi:DICT domain-containing protein
VKTFSIFEYALQLSEIEDANNFRRLIGISRRDFDERQSFVCYTTSASIEYAFLMIENAVLLRTNRAGRVYAGLERLSSFRPIIDRYLRIADVSETVYLFGEADWQPRRHPNIRLVKLDPEFRLAHELFVIAQSSTHNTAFIAQNVTERGSTAARLIRYRALKTSDAAVVGKLTRAVEGLIDWTLAA